MLGDNHPHCCLVIEGAHALYKMNGPENLPQDYLDAMILRLNPHFATKQGKQTGNEMKWYRNHFPVILETNMSQYFNESIYNDMQMDEKTFPTIEFGGYSKKAIQPKLS